MMTTFRRAMSQWTSCANILPAWLPDLRNSPSLTRPVTFKLDWFTRFSVMIFDPRNILVIDFGQLGDVVMSLPALRALRERFPRARITVAVGKPGHEVIGLSGYADATITVDRVSLRDGFKPLSVVRILQVV